MSAIDNIRNFLFKKGTPAKKWSLQARMIPREVKIASIKKLPNANFSIPEKITKSVSPQEKIAKIRLKNRIKAIKSKNNL